MKKAKFLAIFGLLLLISTISIVAFHHHNGFEDHRSDCAICLFASNLPIIPETIVKIFVLFLYYLKVLTLFTPKPNPFKILTVFGRAPPYKVSA